MVYNNETAQVTIKKDSLSKYGEELNKPMFGDQSSSGPVFVFNVPQGDFFGENLDKWQVEYGIEYDFVKQENWMTDILGYLLPFALLIGFWILIMRRMGAGGGAGGQSLQYRQIKGHTFRSKSKRQGKL